MATRTPRISVALGCNEQIAKAVRDFDDACLPSYTITSKKWSVWRLLNEHIEPVALREFENEQPGSYTSWLDAGLTHWMRFDPSGRLAEQKLKRLHRAVDDRLKPSVETLRSLLAFVIGLQPKREIPEEVESLKGAPRRNRLRRISSAPYCELCWRLSQRSEAIERREPTYQEPLGGGVRTTWLSDRFCSHHDPKDPQSDYRRDLRYRDGLESVMSSLRQAIKANPELRAGIARDDPKSAWPTDLRALDLANRVYTAFSPLVMRMRWHAYQIARHRPPDSTIAAVQLARHGLKQADIARRLGLTPQAVSKALRQARGVFDFTMPRGLVWMPDPADAPDNPSYVWLP